MIFLISLSLICADETQRTLHLLLNPNQCRICECSDHIQVFFSVCTNWKLKFPSWSDFISFISRCIRFFKNLLVTHLVKGIFWRILRKFWGYYCGKYLKKCWKKFKKIFRETLQQIFKNFLTNWNFQKIYKKFCENFSHNLWSSFIK